MKLKRKDVADKFYGYHSVHNIGNVLVAKKYLDDITEYLNSFEYESDDDFVFSGRKKIIYNEIIDILDGKQNEKEPVYFVLGSLEEFICNNNFIYSSENDYNNIREKNDKYIMNGYICLEEKEYFDRLISLIKEKLS